MRNKWSEEEAARFVLEQAAQYGEALALRTYSSRLLGAEDSLVLHGGGNTSVKASYRNVFGEEAGAIFVKASGYDMSDIAPEGHTGLDLEYLKKLRRLPELSDLAMVNEFRTHMFDYKSATPSLETLLHAFIDRVFIDHTHPDAILALTNAEGAKESLREALGPDIVVLEYIKPGFRLAAEAAAAYDRHPGARAMILMHHGLVTWGDTARASYERTIEAVSAAEAYIAGKARAPLRAATHTSTETAWTRYERIAPMLRGLLTPSSMPGAAPSGSDPDRPHRNVILRPVISSGILDFLGSGRGRALALTPPLTTDFLIRTKALPVWIDDPDYDDPEDLKGLIAGAVSAYSAHYNAYLDRNDSRLSECIERFDSLPRVVLMPGLGAVCAGADADAARTAADITAHTLLVKAAIGAMGDYRGLDESHLFDMEYRSYQHAKLGGPDTRLQGRVAVVTGAAGAIGTGVCRRLLQEGCHVALTDLPGGPLEKLLSDLKNLFGEKVMAAAMDVTDEASVRAGFAEVVRAWGGVDILVANAGIAMVCSLMEMRLEDFRRLERVNVEGTLTVMSEAGRLFKAQGTGGDVVLVSSKNVFAPGAHFGAYSATKAAAHQLARIASLEFAPMDVRVNMVSPDAVFSEGRTKSGLWKEIGPDRMKARGLDEDGLEDYYRSRNLLKARITARHVANAVLFFVMRLTPTTGATLPVDGGLPDASPR